jgi:hypothetical protein
MQTTFTFNFFDHGIHAHYVGLKVRSINLGCDKAMHRIAIGIKNWGCRKVLRNELAKRNKARQVFKKIDVKGFHGVAPVLNGLCGNNTLAQGARATQMEASRGY